MTIDQAVTTIADARAQAAANAVMAAHIAQYHSSTIPTPPPVVTPPSSSVPAGLKLVYEELFTDSSGLTKQDFYIRTPGGERRPTEVQIWDPSLATISGGQLHLRTQLRNGKWYGCEVDWNRQFNPGYTEMSILGPPKKKPSWWPGPWLVIPHNPYRPEIDFGEDPNIEDNTIGYLTTHTTTAGDSQHWSLTAQRGVPHILGVDWRQRCNVYIDGKLIASDPNPAATGTFSVPMILIIQAHVIAPNIWGPPYDGSWTDESIHIDYVRHYE